jgi:glucose-1-phosphate cytidylyltransferase
MRGDSTTLYLHVSGNHHRRKDPVKAVILAGGFGTRISEESVIRPKPMVEIGGRPILWHIMKIFGAQGVSDFVILAGYRSDVIREYFANYYVNTSDVTFDLATNTVEIHSPRSEQWRVNVVDTGLDAQTGGRLAHARDHLGETTFFLTYGDCVANVDLEALVKLHRHENALVTLTAIKPPGRFGALDLREGSVVNAFKEKPAGDGGWVNGGYFRLHAHRHEGFWQNLDSLRDKNTLEAMWRSGTPEWKIW